MKTETERLRFRMVVLADPLLEAFFDVDLPRSFQLLPVEDSGVRRNQPGLGVLGNAVGGFLSSFVTDDNKKIFNSFVDDMGKAIGKHQVCPKIWRLMDFLPKIALQVTVRPSINQHERNLALQEPLRETTRHFPRTNTQGSGQTSTPSGSSASSIISPSTASLTTKGTLATSPSALKPPATPSSFADDISPLAKANAAAAAVMERQAFAIDEARDEEDLEEDTLDDVGGEEDDSMMDEVDAFLEAHAK